MQNLQGKKALLIGATSGIGLAVATNYVASGANVTITGRRVEGATIAQSIGAAFIRCDATDEAAVQACFDAAESRSGKLDIVVINAGTADDEGSIEDFPVDRANAIFDVNLKAAFLAFKYAPAHIIDGASIIYTGSVVGSGLTHAGTGVYAASKAGGAYLARTSAIENAPRQIRVNAVCPALIANTGMMVADDDNDDARFLSQLTAFGRMGRLDEVVGIYNFLASDASTFITGQEIRVDGGMSAGIGLPVFAAVAAH